MVPAAFTSGLVVLFCFVLVKSCPHDLLTCTENTLDDKSPACSLLNPFFTCLARSSCGLGSQGPAIDLLDAAKMRMEEGGQSCSTQRESVNRGVLRFQRTVQASGPFAEFMKAVSLFWDNQCYDALPDCMNFLKDRTKSQTCSELQTHGHCMFKSCDKIKKSSDVDDAAMAMKRYLWQQYRCDVSTDSLINQAIGVLNRPFWQSLTFLPLATIALVVVLKAFSL